MPISMWYQKSSQVKYTLSVTIQSGDTGFDTGNGKKLNGSQECLASRGGPNSKIWDLTLCGSGSDA